MDSNRKNLALLSQARNDWDHMSVFRQARDRCKRYCYGDQWSDQVMVDGRMMREEHYIRSQGSEPLKNNLIRRLVKHVLGLYRSLYSTGQPAPSSPPNLSDQSDSSDQSDLSDSSDLSSLLLAVRRENCADELDIRMLEEFLISGMAVQRKTGGLRHGHAGCWTDNVQPDHFFVNAEMSDCRGWDVECLGEIHDMRFDAVCQTFARSANDMRRLADIYEAADYRERMRGMLAEWGQAHGPTDFFYPSSPSLCRVVEVWHRVRRQGYLCHDRVGGWLSWTDVMAAEQGADTLPDRMWMVVEEWHYAYLTPFGDVLSEGVSPYLHGGHPYVFKAYPFIDGEIHSFVADIIDQQRYTNRLITLYDWVMRSSAKGVLLVPEECIPDGYSLADVADEWARFNGVIAVKTRNGAMMPQQISANAVNIGINELLQTQLNFMEDISGVTGVLQGKQQKVGVSWTLYEQQTHNATLSQLDLLDTFRCFIDEGRQKDLSNIRQFYCASKSVIPTIKMNDLSLHCNNM